MTQIQGRTVLITGAARGIGRKIAEHFATRGARLVLTDVQEALLAETANAIRSGGTEVRTAKLDVTDTEAIVALRDELRAEGIRIEVLVNNAGVVFGGVFTEVPLERHKLTYDVNTFGVVAMTYHFLPDLIDAAQGHLVNIASASGFIGLPFGATYASSKWAVIGFSESIRLELLQLGHAHVKVTTVCPSYVNTGMFAGVRVPKLTKMLDPEGLGHRIVEAVERDEVMVLEPALVKLVPLLNGFLPRRWLDAINWRLGVASSMRHWRGHEHDRPGGDEQDDEGNEGGAEGTRRSA